MIRLVDNYNNQLFQYTSHVVPVVGDMILIDNEYWVVNHRYIIPKENLYIVSVDPV